MNPRSTVGRIYKEDYYTLLHTKYGSSGPSGFKEEFVLCLFHCKKVQAGKDQEKAQSERDSTPKTEVGKNQTNNQALIP